MSAETNTPVITHAAQILALSTEASKVRPLARIRGVVTYYEPNTALFVQDETAGVFVYCTGGPLDVKVGQWVEVIGPANPGRYSPIIDSPRIQPIDKGPTLRPRTVSLAEIYQGGLDAQLVELTGVVRNQNVVGGQLQFELAVPPHHLSVSVLQYDKRQPLQLEGSVATVRGVVGTLNTEQGDLKGFHIYANTPADVTVIQPSAGDPYSKPPLRIRDLKDQALRRDGVGRVRVQGKVTLCWPGRALFIQDDSGGLEIHPQAPFDQLVAGNALDVVGYLGPALEPPQIEDAVVHELLTGHPPQPVFIPADELFRGRHNNELVEIEATFLEWVDSSSNRPVLGLHAQGHFLTALLELPGRQGILAAIEPGCRVRLTGVSTTRAALRATDPAVFLLLRSPADVRIIGAAPSPQRPGYEASLAAAILAGAVLVAALWYGQKQRRATEHMLQFQASLQAEMRQSEQQLRRSMEERDRIGRDLHDDIIQSIYSVGLNLEDCRRVIRQSPEQAEARVASAINTLNSTIRSVRGFLGGLEPKVLNGHEFKTALKSLALTSGDGPTPVQLDVDPSAANSLSSVHATQLLHIAKEAMSNSLRHARATSVAISLHPVSAGVRLEVRDNGTGFDPDALHGRGHGLRNMTSRAREIGADLQIHSAPGQGCRILVDVPQRKPV